MYCLMERSLYLNIWRELAAAKEMVLLSGPRQCGKTTLAKRIARDFEDSLYLNWDFVKDRKHILKHPDFPDHIPRQGTTPPLIVLDEIHKHRKWKSMLKGLYDTYHEDYRFLVSGSGRLDVYQRGGDSLAGRYEFFHLWPFTLAEIANQRISHAKFFADPLAAGPEGAERATSESWRQLLATGGFPEPFLAGSENRWRRWSRAYGRQLIREDIRDLTGLKQLDLVETLYELLPERIGSPLSLNALAELLQVAYNSVKAWIDVLEKFYLVFRISPWSKRISRGLRKEQKLYIFDLPRIQDPAARFENAVALELHRAVNTWNDLGLDEFSLHYLRTREKREVDFLVVRREKPWLLVETKQSDAQPATELRRFQEMLRIPALQLVNAPVPRARYPGNGADLMVIPAWEWLSRLP